MFKIDRKYPYLHQGSPTLFLESYRPVEPTGGLLSRNSVGDHGLMLSHTGCVYTGIPILIFFPLIGLNHIRSFSELIWLVKRQISARGLNSWWLRSPTPLSSVLSSWLFTADRTRRKHKESQLPHPTMLNTIASVPKLDKELWLRLHRQPNSVIFSLIGVLTNQIFFRTDLMWF